MDPVKKPDVIPPKKDALPAQPMGIKKPEPPKSVPSNPKTSASTPWAPLSDRTPETPQSIETMTPSLPKDIPKTSESSVLMPFKAPEKPKTPESPKITQKFSEPEPWKTAPVSPKTPELFKPTPVSPKTPEASKFLDSPKVSPKSPDPPKVSEFSKSVKTPEPVTDPIASRKGQPSMPTFPASKHPAPGSNQDISLPPFRPGASAQGDIKPIERGDELFGNTNKDYNDPSKTLSNLRDLSYGKGEFPDDGLTDDIQKKLPTRPKYMEQSMISNPDSLESSEEEEEDDDDY